MSAEDSLHILLAGGGTGGHIFPLLAIAESLRVIESSATCLFVCSTRPLDAEILTREGEAFDAIPARPFGVRPKTLGRFILGWGGAVRAARQVIRAHTARVVITSGGFVSAPMVQAARRDRVPVVAVNLDAVAGKANRWIARHAAVCLSTTDTDWDKVPKDWQRVAPIVRASMRTTQDPADARQALGLDPDIKTMLVTGGSQGASTLNGTVAWAALHHAGWFEGWQVLHQCGGDPKQARMLKQVYEDKQIAATVLPFIDDMASAWRAADCAVSRAGAGAVAEVQASCTPTLFLPYPFHRDWHQLHNCAHLTTDAGAGLDNLEQAEPDWSIASLMEDEGVYFPDWDIEQLLTDPKVLSEMRDNLAALGPCDGADAAARVAIEVAGKGNH